LGSSKSMDTLLGLLPILLPLCFTGADSQSAREFNGDVTIISTDWAAEIEGGKLGAYNEVPRLKCKGKPVYRQKDTLKNSRISKNPENFLFYHEYSTNDAAWIVSPEKCDTGLVDSTRLVEKAGLVRMCQNNRDPGCDKPPKSGWQYWDWQNDKWKQDASVELLYNYADPPCAEVEISHSAIAKDLGLANYNREAWNDILGTYHIKPGVLSQGRPTYKKEGAQMFLLVAEGWPHWEVARSPYTKRKEVLLQSGKGTLRPEDAGPSITYKINSWRFCVNLSSGCPNPDKGWVDAWTAQDAAIDVKCVRNYNFSG